MSNMVLVCYLRPYACIYGDKSFHSYQIARERIQIKYIDVNVFVGMCIRCEKEMLNMQFILQLIINE